MAKNVITQEFLKECVTYDPDTGIFIRNTRPLSHFKNSNIWNSWNSKTKGKECGSIKTVSGYRMICIDSKLYLAHRLAFLYMEGYMPENQVDHIDRDKMNNKWSNLREVSNQCNGQNCNLSKNNKSGVCGVSWSKWANKWVAYIKTNFKQKILGYFKNFEDAVMARYNEELTNPKWICSVDSTAYKYLKERNLI